MTDARPTVRLPASDLRRYMADLLVGAGAAREHAVVAARMFVEADLRGVGPQGVDYAYTILDGLKRGIVDGKAGPVVVRETVATILIDGNAGLGQPAALLAIEKLVPKARAAGSATAVVRNATDIFMIGLYAELIARAGLVGFVTTSGPPLVHPHGGTERLLSTNPMAWGFPRRGEPFVLDMATSQTASSRVRQAAYHDEHLAPGCGIGPDGQPTTQARAIRKGALSPLGGHKGFGLGLVVALLCGPMTGSGIGRELAGWQAEGEAQTQGHVLMAIDPAAFVPFEEFLARSEAYIDEIKSSALAEGSDGIRIPGERMAAALARNTRHGVPVLAETWGILKRYAEELGVPVPDVEPVAG